MRGPQRPGPSGGGPLAVVCGLPVVVRSLLVLERVGFARAVLLVDPDDRAAVAGALAAHPRLRLRYELAEDAGESLTPAARALQDAAPAAWVLYWPATVSFGRLAPALVPAADAEAEAETVRLGGGEPAVPGATPAALIETSVAVLRTHAELSPAALCAAQRARGRLREAAPPARRPVAVVDDASRRRAERELLQSLRKDADGVVARFDRNVSLAISRRLMALPVRPNQVTLFAALVGILCGLVVSRGGYLLMLCGAIGFQLNSILDGVDGEIARAKLLESAAGQWFDTLADDLSNLAFMIGVSIGSYRTWGSPVYLLLGAVSAGGFLIASTLMYHYLITRAHSGDLNDFALPWEEGQQGRRDLRLRARGRVSRFIARIKWVARRDAYVFLSVLCGVLGQLRIMVWLFAAGTTVTWATIFAYRGLVPFLQRRARPAL